MTALYSSRDPRSLRRAPLHKTHVPAPDKDSPQWAAFIETVRADGRVRVPVVITPGGLVADGWWRAEAARDLQLETIPCEEVPEQEAALIIVESLTARKQMTRGATVYLALGLLESYADAAEARRLRNVTAQRTTGEQRIDQKSLSSTPQAAGEYSPTLRYLGERWGVDHKTIFQARLVHRCLHDPKNFALWMKNIGVKGTPDDFAKSQAAIRAEFEPLLYNGDKSLWAILQAAAGRLTGKRHDLTRGLEQQLDLFGDHLTRWSLEYRGMDDMQRNVFRARLPILVHQLDPDFIEELQTAIDKSRKKQPKE
jgi:hypothetical protein